MGDGGALRQVFAELGFEVDSKKLDAANKLVDAAIAKTRTLVTSAGLVDKAEASLAARSQARAAARHQQSVQATADAAREHGPQGEAREVGFFAKLRELAAHDAKLKADALKAANDAEAASKARKLLGHEEPKHNPFAKAQQQGATGFGGKFGTDRWKEQAKPIQGLLDLVVRFEKRASTAIGQKLPAAFQKLAVKMGVAKGDFATMGQLLTGATGTLGAVLGTAAAMAAGFVAEFTATSEALRETARQARVTSSELQALQHAGAVSGVGADRMTSSVTALGQKLRDANSHLAGSGVVHTLRRMGISARDSSGQIRPTLDILDDVAEAMAHISSPRRRVQIVEALGLDRRLLDVLHPGIGGIRQLREELAQYGGGVTPEATEAARRFGIAQARATLAMTSMRSVIFTSLAPTVESLVTKGAKLLGWLSNVTRGSHFVRNALVALGVAGAAAAAPMIVAWAPMILTVGGLALGALALALALDDVQNFMEGNNSLTGEFVDKLKELADGFIGLGNSTRIIQAIRADWDALGQKIAATFDFIDRLPAALQAVLAPLRALRGIYLAATGGDAGVSGGGAGAPPGQPPATPPSRGGPAPVQLGFDGQPIPVPAPVARGGHAVAIPATRAVPAPGSSSGGTNTVTTRVEGDRNTFHINGNDPVAMRREVENLLDQRERRRNAERSPREPQP